MTGISRTRQVRKKGSKKGQKMSKKGCFFGTMGTYRGSKNTHPKRSKSRGKLRDLKMGKNGQNDKKRAKWCISVISGIFIVTESKGLKPKMTRFVMLNDKEGNIT